MSHRAFFPLFVFHQLKGMTDVHQDSQQHEEEGLVVVERLDAGGKKDPGDYHCQACGWTARQAAPSTQVEKCRESAFKSHHARGQANQTRLRRRGRKKLVYDRLTTGSGGR